MPALNKQTLINLLIDSPLREPIKINLIDIVNNTNDVDLPKTYSTISKELEIFQKATERRMKLADETIAKLKEDGSGAPASSAEPSALPPLPPLPTTPTPTASAEPAPSDNPGLSAPSLDLPPLPKMNTAAEEPTPTPSLPPTPPAAEPSAPTPTLAPAAPVSDLPPAPSLQTAPTASADEDALKEIQKELDSLKSSASEEAGVTPAPTATEIPAAAPQA